MQNIFLTPHFTLQELCASQTAVKHGIVNVPSELEVENLRRLCEGCLEPLREAIGLPVIITSGFRTKELNDKLARLTELNALLNMDEKGDNTLDVDEESVGDGNLAMASEKKAVYMASEPEVAYTPAPQKQQASQEKTNETKDRRRILHREQTT